MKQHQSHLLLSAAAALVFLGGAPSLLADGPSCRLSTLKGSYGYTVTGSINAGATPALPPGPFAAVGKLVFNGVGGVTTVRTLSANGTVIRADAGSGSYTVNADCTGSFNISIATPSGVVILGLDYILDDRNSQLRAIVTNNGYVLTLSGRPQFGGSGDN